MHKTTLPLTALGIPLAGGIVHTAPFALDAAGRLPAIVTDGAPTTHLAGDLPDKKKPGSGLPIRQN